MRRFISVLAVMALMAAMMAVMAMPAFATHGGDKQRVEDILDAGQSGLEEAEQRGPASVDIPPIPPASLDIPLRMRATSPGASLDIPLRMRATSPGSTRSLDIPILVADDMPFLFPG